MSDIGGTEPSFGVPETFRPFGTNSSISHATAGRVQERGSQSAPPPTFFLDGFPSDSNVIEIYNRNIKT